VRYVAIRTEEVRVVFTEVEVRSQPDNHGGVDVAVRATRKITNVVRQHRSVDLREPVPFEAAVEQPRNDGQAKSGNNSDPVDTVSTCG
jgi:hypothetical protein